MLKISKLFSRISIVIYSLFVTQTAFAQPFGIVAGTTISKFQVEKEISTFKYKIKLPSSHAEFESITVVATPGQGVCMVTGVGVNHNNDGYGQEIRRAFKEIRSQVSTSYGTSDLYDNLKTGALWKEPREWVMSLKQNERSYQASWDDESKFTPKNRVKEILLTTVALDSDTSFLSLQFRFDNHAACDAERKSAASRAF